MATSLTIDETRTGGVCNLAALRQRSAALDHARSNSAIFRGNGSRCKVARRVRTRAAGGRPLVGCCFPGPWGPSRGAVSTLAQFLAVAPAHRFDDAAESRLPFCLAGMVDLRREVNASWSLRPELSLRAPCRWDLRSPLCWMAALAARRRSKWCRIE